MGGTPKWTVYKGRPYENGLVGVSPILGNSQVEVSSWENHPTSGGFSIATLDWRVDDSLVWVFNL